MSSAPIPVTMPSIRSGSAKGNRAEDVDGGLLGLLCIT